jgi:tetratricopeptide (TPR) repeat protein
VSPSQRVPSDSGASFPPSASDPYGSSIPPAASRPPSDPARGSVDSSLMRLIQELAGGPGMQRWTAARLREALHEELAGNFTQAVAIINVVMAQIEDPRIRSERDRIQGKVLQAASGVYRKQAIDAERGLRHHEAADAWRKVLEAQPNDADAALHAAMCSMEAGNLKQAGALARRAVELAPNSINAHRLLYRFFRKTGMEASAKRESEILAKLRKV